MNPSIFIFISSFLLSGCNNQQQATENSKGNVAGINIKNERQVDWYNDSDYIVSYKGADSLYPYTIVSKNRRDTNYSKHQLFWDSLYLRLLTTQYMWKGKLHGPALGHDGEAILRRSAYRFGKKHGEQVSYENGKIREIRFYTNGVRTGVWQDFNSSGKLIRTVSYSSTGKVLEELQF